MLRRLVTGPSFLISAHLGLLFAVSYVVLFLVNVLDSPAATRGVFDGEVETKDLCGVAYIWRLRSSISDVASHFGKTGSDHGGFFSAMLEKGTSHVVLSRDTAGAPKSNDRETSPWWSLRRLMFGVVPEPPRRSKTKQRTTGKSTAKHDIKAANATSTGLYGRRSQEEPTSDESTSTAEESFEQEVFSSVTNNGKKSFSSSAGVLSSTTSATGSAWAEPEKTTSALAGSSSSTSSFFPSGSRAPPIFNITGLVTLPELDWHIERTAKAYDCFDRTVLTNRREPLADLCATMCGVYVDMEPAPFYFNAASISLLHHLIHLALGVWLLALSARIEMSKITGQDTDQFVGPVRQNVACFWFYVALDAFVRYQHLHQEVAYMGGRAIFLTIFAVETAQAGSCFLLVTCAFIFCISFGFLIARLYMTVTGCVRFVFRLAHFVCFHKTLNGKKFVSAPCDNEDVCAICLCALHPAGLWLPRSMSDAIRNAHEDHRLQKHYEDARKARLQCALENAEKLKEGSPEEEETDASRRRKNIPRRMGSARNKRSPTGSPIRKRAGLSQSQTQSPSQFQRNALEDEDEDDDDLLICTEVGEEDNDDILAPALSTGGGTDALGSTFFSAGWPAGNATTRLTRTEVLYRVAEHAAALAQSCVRSVQMRMRVYIAGTVIVFADIFHSTFAQRSTFRAYGIPTADRILAYLGLDLAGAEDEFHSSWGEPVESLSGSVDVDDDDDQANRSRGRRGRDTVRLHSSTTGAGSAASMPSIEEKDAGALARNLDAVTPPRRRDMRVVAGVVPMGEGEAEGHDEITSEDFLRSRRVLDLQRDDEQAEEDECEKGDYNITSGLSQRRGARSSTYNNPSLDDPHQRDLLFGVRSLGLVDPLRMSQSPLDDDTMSSLGRRHGDFRTSFHSQRFRKQNALLKLQECGHLFHYSCLSDCFREAKFRKKTSCPLCRTNNERVVWRTQSFVDPQQAPQPWRQQVATFGRELVEFLIQEVDILYFGLMIYIFLIAFSTTILLEFFLYAMAQFSSMLRSLNMLLEGAYEMHQMGAAPGVSMADGSALDTTAHHDTLLVGDHGLSDDSTTSWLQGSSPRVARPGKQGRQPRPISTLHTTSTVRREGRPGAIAGASGNSATLPNMPPRPRPSWSVQYIAPWTLIGTKDYIGMGGPSMWPLPPFTRRRPRPPQRKRLQHQMAHSAVPDHARVNDREMNSTANSTSSWRLHDPLDRSANPTQSHRGASGESRAASARSVSPFGDSETSSKKQEGVALGETPRGNPALLESSDDTRLNVPLSLDDNPRTVFEKQDDNIISVSLSGFDYAGVEEEGAFISNFAKQEEHVEEDFFDFEVLESTQRSSRRHWMPVLPERVVSENNATAGSFRDGTSSNPFPGEVVEVKIRDSTARRVRGGNDRAQAPEVIESASVLEKSDAKREQSSASDEGVPGVTGACRQDEDPLRRTFSSLASPVFTNLGRLLSASVRYWRYDVPASSMADESGALGHSGEDEDLVMTAEEFFTFDWAGEAEALASAAQNNPEVSMPSTNSYDSRAGGVESEDRLMPASAASTIGRGERMGASTARGENAEVLTEIKSPQQAAELSESKKVVLRDQERVLRRQGARQALREGAISQRVASFFKISATPDNNSFLAGGASYLQQKSHVVDKEVAAFQRGRRLNPVNKRPTLEWLSSIVSQHFGNFSGIDYAAGGNNLARRTALNLTWTLWDAHPNATRQVESRGWQRERLDSVAFIDVIEEILLFRNATLVTPFLRYLITGKVDSGAKHAFVKMEREGGALVLEASHEEQTRNLKQVQEVNEKSTSETQTYDEDYWRTSLVADFLDHRAMAALALQDTDNTAIVVPSLEEFHSESESAGHEGGDQKDSVERPLSLGSEKKRAVLDSAREAFLHGCLHGLKELVVYRPLWILALYGSGTMIMNGDEQPSQTRQELLSGPTTENNITAGGASTGGAASFHAARDRVESEAGGPKSTSGGYREVRPRASAHAVRYETKGDGEVLESVALSGSTAVASNGMSTRAFLWWVAVNYFTKTQLFCMFMMPVTFLLVALLLYEYREFLEWFWRRLGFLYLRCFGDRLDIRIRIRAEQSPASNPAAVPGGDGYSAPAGHSSVQLTGSPAAAQRIQAGLTGNRSHIADALFGSEEAPDANEFMDGAGGEAAVPVISAVLDLQDEDEHEYVDMLSQLRAQRAAARAAAAAANGGTSAAGGSMGVAPGTASNSPTLAQTGPVSSSSSINAPPPVTSDRLPIGSLTNGSPSGYSVGSTTAAGASSSSAGTSQSLVGTPAGGSFHLGATTGAPGGASVLAGVSPSPGSLLSTLLGSTSEQINQELYFGQASSDGGSSDGDSLDDAGEGALELLGNALDDALGVGTGTDPAPGPGAQMAAGHNNFFVVFIFTPFLHYANEGVKMLIFSLTLLAGLARWLLEATVQASVEVVVEAVSAANAEVLPLYFPPKSTRRITKFARLTVKDSIRKYLCAHRKGAEEAEESSPSHVNANSMIRQNGRNEDVADPPSKDESPQFSQQPGRGHFRRSRDGSFPANLLEAARMISFGEESNADAALRARNGSTKGFESHGSYASRSVSESEAGSTSEGSSSTISSSDSTPVVHTPVHELPFDHPEAMALRRRAATFGKSRREVDKTRDHRSLGRSVSATTPSSSDGGSALQDYSRAGGDVDVEEMSIEEEGGGTTEVGVIARAFARLQQGFWSGLFVCHYCVVLVFLFTLKVLHFIFIRVVLVQILLRPPMWLFGAAPSSVPRSWRQPAPEVEYDEEGSSSCSESQTEVEECESPALIASTPLNLGRSLSWPQDEVSSTRRRRRREYDDDLIRPRSRRSSQWSSPSSQHIVDAQQHALIPRVYYVRASAEEGLARHRALLAGCVRAVSSLIRRAVAECFRSREDESRGRASRFINLDDDHASNLGALSSPGDGEHDSRRLRQHSHGDNYSAFSSDQNEGPQQLLPRMRGRRRRDDLVLEPAHGSISSMSERRLRSGESSSEEDYTPPLLFPNDEEPPMTGEEYAGVLNEILDAEEQGLSPPDPNADLDLGLSIRGVMTWVLFAPVATAIEVTWIFCVRFWRAFSWFFRWTSPRPAGLNPSAPGQGSDAAFGGLSPSTAGDNHSITGLQADNIHGAPEQGPSNVASPMPAGPQSSATAEQAAPAVIGMPDLLLFPVGEERMVGPGESMLRVVYARVDAFDLTFGRRMLLALVCSYPLAYCMVRWWLASNLIYLSLLLGPIMW
ncbi:unnamed protein product [Amoebophrya sp. A25]|nr:unnamed protein product [Amoebophrya sp. A25]|eukprot:GSA25T00005630001.1